MIVLLIELFAALSGCIEAILYARRGAEAFTFNEHVLYGLQRLTVLLLLLAGAWLPGHLHQTPGTVSLAVLPGLLLFPMAHDEAYNLTRLWLTESAATGPAAAIWGTNRPGWLCWLLSPLGSDGCALSRALQAYRYGYQSPTTTARNDFNGKQRTGLAAGALLIWLVQAYLTYFCK